VRIASSCLVSILLIGLTAVPAAAVADPVRLDVGLSADADPAAVLAALGDVVVSSEPVPGLSALTVDVPADRATATLARLGTTSGVRFAEFGSLVQADGEQIPSFYDSMEIRQAWTWTLGDPEVTVAVVDTGVNVTPDLAADRIMPGYDFIDGDADTADDDGHGTLMASVVAADPDNNAGTKGVCGRCRVMPVRVLQDRGTAPADGTTADVAAGIVWAADRGAHIVNLSFSTDVRSLLLEDAVRHASDKGALVVASAGNVQSTARRYPAAFDDVLAVTRLDLYQNTESDRWVDVSAFENGMALKPNGNWAYSRGASVSTAVVSGVAALGLATKPAASAAEIRSAIIRTAYPRDVYGLNPPLVNGAGTVFAMGAVDTVPPVITRTSLTEGEWVPGGSKPVLPIATDDHGIERIEYLVDGKVVVTAPQSGSQVYFRMPVGYSGSVPVVVRGYDYAGNIGEQTVVVETDTKAPVGTVITPVAGSVVPSDFEVIVEAPDDDTESVTGSFRNQTFTFARISGTNRWRGSVNLSSVGSFFVVLRDKLGNRDSIYHPLTVDDQPPAGGVVSPKAGARLRGTFTSSVAGLVDASGVASAELWANGTYVGTDRTAPFTLAVKTGAYNGNVRLVWRVTDRFGQARTLATHIVVADNAGPAVSISNGPKNKAKIKGTTRVYVKASDASGIARVELIVNGKVVARDYAAAYVLAFNASKQKKTMKVQVRAYDKLGNVKYTSTRTWYRR
jgi:hypothetical protein